MTFRRDGSLGAGGVPGACSGGSVPRGRALGGLGPDTWSSRAQQEGTGGLSTPNTDRGNSRLSADLDTFPWIVTKPSQSRAPQMGAGG